MKATIAAKVSVVYNENKPERLIVKNAIKYGLH